MLYLYGYVIFNKEIHCVKYIILVRNSLPKLDSCPKLKYGILFGGTLNKHQKNNRNRDLNGDFLKLLIYEVKKSYQTYHSLRK